MPHIIIIRISLVKSDARMVCCFLQKFGHFFVNYSILWTLLLGLVKAHLLLIIRTFLKRVRLLLRHLSQLFSKRQRVSHPDFAFICTQITDHLVESH